MVHLHAKDISTFWRRALCLLFVAARHVPTLDGLSVISVLLAVEQSSRSDWLCLLSEPIMCPLEKWRKQRSNSKAKLQVLSNICAFSSTSRWIGRAIGWSNCLILMTHNKPQSHRPEQVEWLKSNITMSDINIRLGMHISSQQKSRGGLTKEERKKDRGKKTSFRIRTIVAELSENVKKELSIFCFL